MFKDYAMLPRLAQPALAAVLIIGVLVGPVLANHLPDRTITGTSGDDSLNGSHSYDDTILAYGGNDTLGRGRVKTGCLGMEETTPYVGTTGVIS